MICAIVNEQQPTFFFLFKFSSKVHSLLLNSFTFHFFTKRCLANKRSSPGMYIGGGGGGGGGVGGKFKIRVITGRG